MLNIRKRKRFRFVIIFISALIILFALFCILGFTQSKIHRKSLTKLDMPDNAALYISMYSVNDIYSKILKSAYLYRTSRDKELFEYSVIFKSSEILIEKLQNLNFPFGMTAKYIFSRQGAFVLYEKTREDISSADYSFIFDIGMAPSFVLETFISKDKSDYSMEEGNIYIKNEEEYQGAAIKVIKIQKDYPDIYFTIYKGLIVFSSSKEKAKNMLDFLYSQKKRTQNTKQYKAKFSPDISFYANLKKINNTLKTDIGTEDIEDVYGYVKLKEEVSKIDMYLTHPNETGKMYEIYKNKTEETIPNYIPQSVPLYMSVDASAYAWYTAIFSKFLASENIDKEHTLKQSVKNFNSKYNITNIINAVDNQMSFFYIKDKEENIPVIALKFKNEAVAIPMLEKMLAENFSEIKKESLSYHKYYIYTYSMKNEKPVYYTSINGIFFFSNYEAPIKTVIDENMKGKNLAKLFAKNKISTKNANYLLYMDFKNSMEILKDIGLPYKIYSYPKYIFASANVTEQYTYIESNVYIDLKEIE